MEKKYTYSNISSSFYLPDKALKRANNYSLLAGVSF